MPGLSLVHFNAETYEFVGTLFLGLCYRMAKTASSLRAYTVLVDLSFQY
jgi:hypothetical protein